MELVLALVLFFSLIVAWIVLPGVSSTHASSMAEPEENAAGTSTTMQSAA